MCRSCRHPGANLKTSDGFPVALVWRRPANSGLDFAALEASNPVPSRSFDEVDEIVSYLAESAVEGDHIVVMSNSGFGGIHGKLLGALR